MSGLFSSKLLSYLHFVIILFVFRCSWIRSTSVVCNVQCAICNVQSALSKCGLSMFLQTVPIDLSMTLRIARICFCLFANVLVLAFAASDVFLVGKTLDSLWT